MSRLKLAIAVLAIGLLSGCIDSKDAYEDIMGLRPPETGLGATGYTNVEAEGRFFKIGYISTELNESFLRDETSRVEPYMGVGFVLGVFFKKDL